MAKLFFGNEGNVEMTIFFVVIALGEFVVLNGCAELFHHGDEFVQGALGDVEPVGQLGGRTGRLVLDDLVDPFESLYEFARHGVKIKKADVSTLAFLALCLL